MMGGLFAENPKILPRADRADGVRQILFDHLSALGGDATEVSRDGGGGEHKYKCNKREANTGDSRRDEHLIHGDDIEVEDIEGYMFEWLDVQDGRQREEEEDDGQRGEHGE